MQVPIFIVESGTGTDALDYLRMGGTREEVNSALMLSVKAIVSKVRAENSLPVSGDGNAGARGPMIKFDRMTRSAG